MSLRIGHLFEFEEFRLDVAEKLLLRGGEAISLTPKVFETLQVLVENAGHLVEKDELMQRIWPDRFVEESNLSFNIKMLRKALGDSAAAPTFIETVPRRGYRFIADVTLDASEKLPDPGESSVLTSPMEAGPGRSRPYWTLFPVVSAIFVIGIGIWLWQGRVSESGSGPPILSAAFSSENLSTSGKVMHAAISPDGKIIAYTNGLGGDKQSVWIRQLNSSNNIQIIPPSDDFYFNLAFSPDGNFLYFVRGPQPGDPSVQNAVYRISIFGGVASKIVGEVQAGVSVSPDGSKISFVRCYFRDDEWCSLSIADAVDGKNERKLVSKQRPFRIADSAISPDGRTIAFGVGQSRNGANEFSLAEVDIETGIERELAAERFFDIKKLLWLPGQKGLLATALRFPDKNFRIWRVPGFSEPAEALTKDSADYSGLSLDDDARTLVATAVRPDFHLNLYQKQDPAKPRQISSDAATVTFAPDRQLAISTGRTGHHDIWSVDAGGGTEKQLTTDPLDDLDPLFSADGASIFFASNRTGKIQVWRMRSDGSDQTQVTTGEGGFPIAISPDGKWLYYHAALGRTLMRVSVDGGEEQTVIDKIKHIFAMSPDCSMAAYAEDQSGQTMLTVVSLADGQTVRSVASDGQKMKTVGMAWSADGRNLYYISAVNNYENNAVWVLPLDKGKPGKVFDLRNEGVRNDNSFAVSPDGSSFAVVQGSWQRDAVLINGLK